MRWQVRRDEGQERQYRRISMSGVQLGYVRDAAREFDAISTLYDDTWTAEEFVDWLCADVREIG